MSVKANVRQSGTVAIVELSGRITLGEGTGALREAIQTVLGEGHKNIVLNLGDVSYVDSAGLGEMVGSYTTVSNQGGSLKLANVQKKMKDLLQITKLYTVFQTYESEQEAVASFNQAAGA